MYFFAGSDECLKAIPALAVMSSSCGIGRPAHWAAFAPGWGGGGTLCPSCAREAFVPQSIRKIVGKAPRTAFLFNLVPLRVVLSSRRCPLAFVAIPVFHYPVECRLFVCLRQDTRTSVIGLGPRFSSLRLFFQRCRFPGFRQPRWTKNGELAGVCAARFAMVLLSLVFP